MSSKPKATTEARDIALSDPQIRSALIKKLEKSSTKPKVLIEELRVHNGNAIADVVAVYNEAHCYEIKGDSDKIERALDQGKYYDLAFRKITLVTTSRHISKALIKTPQHWGVIEAKEKQGKVIFRNIRPATHNPNFNKKIALLTLWRSELVEIACDLKEQFSSKASREALSQIISESIGREQLSLSISAKLASRSS